MLIPYEEKYAEQVKELLATTDNHVPMSDTNQVFLEIIRGDVVGVGSLWRNTIHPSRDYISLYILDSYRREGIGTNIFQALVFLSEKKKFQVSTQSKNTNTIAFLHSVGFKRVRKCYEISIERIDFPFNDVKIKSGKILSVAELEVHLANEAFKLQMNNYQRFHETVNPLNENLSLKAWKEIILDNLNIESSFVLIDEGEIQAYVFTYYAAKDDLLEVGYIGGKDMKQQKYYLSFYKVVFSHLIKDYQKIFIEADDIDPYAYSVLNLFPFDTEESLDTYILDE